jgi:F-type H+-transporting ATPase subunit delta
MTARVAAARYARALFDVVLKERLDVDKIERDLAAFAELVNGHDALRRALSNPAIPPSRKRGVIEQLVAQQPVSGPVARTLTMLAERDRLALLGDLTNAFRERVMDHRQVVRAEITTAVALPADRVAALQQGIARATGRQVQLETRIDPAIIGGAVTRIGSTIYDGSVTTQLQRLKERLSATSE